MSSGPSTSPRLLLVNSNLLIDVGDLAPRLAAAAMAQRADDHADASFRRARALARRARSPQYMTFNPRQSQQPAQLPDPARENARGIRENISAEMWESLNTLYWSIRSDDAPARFEESPDDFYRQVMNRARCCSRA